MEVIHQNQDIRNMQTLKWVCALQAALLFKPTLYSVTVTYMEIKINGYSRSRASEKT